MKFKIEALTIVFAKEMIEKWTYDSPYSAYDYVNESEELLDMSNWGRTRFAVLGDDKLIGELTVEFFEPEDETSEDDGYVTPETVLSNPSGIYELWMGWGLKPTLCGQGIGNQFVSACIAFAIDRYSYKGHFVYCAVAESNLRASKLYRSMDFKVFNRLVTEENGEEKVILQMKKAL